MEECEPLRTPLREDHLEMRSEAVVRLEAKNEKSLEQCAATAM